MLRLSVNMDFGSHIARSAVGRPFANTARRKDGALLVVEDLKQLMQRQITSQEDAYTLFHMFYPSEDEEKIKQVSAQDIQAWFDELAGLSSGEALT